MVHPFWFDSHVTDPGQCALFMWKILVFEPKGDVDQGNENRNLDKRADNRCKGLAGVDAEDGDGHGNNSQLQVCWKQQ